MSRALSLPHEHGAYLTIVGATVNGVALAHTRGPAVAISAVVAAAFFARGPAESLWRRRAARFDGAAVAALTAVVLGGALALGAAWGALALLFAAAIVSSSAIARMGRWQRATGFETFAMAALGASAGLVVVAGGADPRLGAALAIVVGTHSALAVPLVRTELRPRERRLARSSAWIALAILTMAATVLTIFGLGRCSFALLPRAMHALWRCNSQQRKARASIVGIRETALLGLVVLILVVGGGFMSKM